MRIITNDDAIDISYGENAGSKITEFLSKHKNQEIHILLPERNGYTNSEKIIHDNIEIFKQFAKCNITFEYEGKLESFGMWNPYDMEKYKERHIDGERKDRNKVFSIEQIIKDEDFIFKIANEINNSGFSMLEKVFAIHNLTSSIKSYAREKYGDIAQSRSLFEYLNNNYMVCAGYCNLMETLCYLCGIPTEHEVVWSKNGDKHARIYANIYDEKYKVNGYYVFDPTKDQNHKKEYGKRYYKYFLMTTSNAHEDGDCSSHDVLSDVLSYKDEEDFKKHFDYIYDRNALLSIFKCLDQEFAIRFQKLDLTKDDDIKVLVNYLKEKINREVDTETIDKVKLAFASKIFKGTKEDVEKLVRPMTQEEKDSLQEAKIQKFLQKQGYTEKEMDNIVQKSIDRLKFLYDILYKKTIEAYKEGKVWDSDAREYLPSGEIIIEAIRIIVAIEELINKKINKIENVEEAIAELKEMGYVVDEEGRINGDNKFEQIIKMAEIQAKNNELIEGRE